MYVREKIELGWSPQIIANRIGMDKQGQSISHESIYQYIYHQAKELIKDLPRKGKSRGINRASGRRPRAVEESKRSIELRPVKANLRGEPGHWESDLIVSARHGKSSLLVLVDRQNRHLHLRLLPNRQAHTVRQALFTILQAQVKKTLTVDNGPEHQELAFLEPVFADNDFKIYFCHPYCAWERGTVEAINGILRRFFPKKTNFDEVTAQQVQNVQDWFNHRPMKVLGYLTPLEYESKMAA